MEVNEEANKFGLAKFQTQVAEMENDPEADEDSSKAQAD